MKPRKLELMAFCEVCGEKYRTGTRWPWRRRAAYWRLRRWADRHDCGAVMEVRREALMRDMFCVWGDVLLDDRSPRG